MSALDTLLEMGFSQTKAERALSVTGNTDVESAMEWLLAHGDEPEVEFLPQNETAAAAGESVSVTEVEPDITEKSSEEIQMPDPKSIKCDDCGKKFRSDAEVEFHAVKSGHANFSQSEEEIKPLTEEEKLEQRRRIENLIKQRRAEKAEQEKKEALEKEKSRRKTGQELTFVRQRLEEEEMKRLAEQTRKEKIEAKLAKQKVLEEIERDKQARREKFGMTGGVNTTPAPIISPEQTVTQPTEPKKEYDQCRLQIRLTNGQCLVQSFGANEELAAVRLYIELNRTDGNGPFQLMTNFPKKVFTEEDMSCPLSHLGLVPSAVLIVSKATR